MQNEMQIKDKTCPVCKEGYLLPPNTPDAPKSWYECTRCVFEGNIPKNKYLKLNNYIHENQRDSVKKEERIIGELYLKLIRKEIQK